MKNKEPKQYITAYSSHGTFDFDPATGAVVKLELDESFGVKPFRVDVQEWKACYDTTEFPEHGVDILDLGYWTTKGYEEPAHDWRAERLELRKEGFDGTIILKT